MKDESDPSSLIPHPSSFSSARVVAEGALIEIVDGVADLIPVSAARQSFELGGQPIALLGGRLGEAHVEAAQKRIVAQGEQRNCRAGLQVATAQLNAQHLMRLQVDDGGAVGQAQRGAVVVEELQLRETELVAEDAGLNTFDVVDVAEHARDGLRFVAT